MSNEATAGSEAVDDRPEVYGPAVIHPTDLRPKNDVEVEVFDADDITADGRDIFFNFLPVMAAKRGDMVGDEFFGTKTVRVP